MTRVFLFAVLLTVVYSCIELSGKERKPLASGAALSDQTKPLRVGRAEAMAMRGRRAKEKDDASVKMSVKDLMDLLQGASVSEQDSFIFYFVKYDPGSPSEKARYQHKVKGANWASIQKKPSSLLVGYVPGQRQQGMLLSRPPRLQTVTLYDLAVLCPPPPDCDCEIAQ